MSKAWVSSMIISWTQSKYKYIANTRVQDPIEQLRLLEEESREENESSDTELDLEELQYDDRVLHQAREIEENDEIEEVYISP